MKYLSLINIRSVLLALVPILGIYQIISGVTLDVVLLFFILILSFNKLQLNKELSRFFFAIIVVSIISHAFSTNQSSSLFVNNTLQILAFAILLSFYVNFNVNRVFIKTLLFLGVLSTLLLFYQIFSFYVLSTPVTFFLPIDMGIEDSTKTFSIHWGRPNSFFMEPAHYGIFILPLFNYTLTYNKKMLSLVFFSGILLSTSTTGFLGVIVLFAYKKINIRRNMKFILVFMFFLLFIIFFFQDNIASILERNLEKLNSNSLSENIRVFGGFSLLSFVDSFSFIFGLGHNQLSHYMSLKGMDVPNYSNSFLMSIFSYGFLGFLGFLILIKHFYKVSIDKGYFIIFILVLLSDQILFNRNFFYLTSCIFFLNRHTFKLTK